MSTKFNNTTDFLSFSVLLKTYVYLKKCYLNNHSVDNLLDSHDLKRKGRYLQENQNNREIK